MPGIYLKAGGAYVAMVETPFAAESELQQLIADHPEVLQDEDAGRGPLLLIKREAGVVDEDDAPDRWSLDHLYVDAEGVPTLVEVKRSSDTRGRREVVAQMLDYAANAKSSFPVARMTEWLDAQARRRGTTTEELLGKAFGTEDVEAFWQQVASHIDAERFRLIFVSDRIPRELRTIIEFLNGQMGRTDVLAIEVKQYVDAAGEHQTVVPRVIGNTETARMTKRRSGSSKMTRQRLLEELGQVSPDAAVAATELLRWAEEHPLLNVRWNTAGDIGLARGDRGLLRIWSEGTLETKVWTLRHITSAWDETRTDDLVRRLDELPGIQLTGNRRDWPRTELAPMADPGVRKRFTDVYEEVVASLP